MKELPRVSHSDFKEYWPVTTTECRDKNSERIWVPTASFKSHDRFTEFLVRSWVFAGKLNISRTEHAVRLKLSEYVNGH